MSNIFIRPGALIIIHGAAPASLQAQRNSERPGEVCSDWLGAGEHGRRYSSGSVDASHAAFARRLWGDRMPVERGWMPPRSPPASHLDADRAMLISRARKSRPTDEENEAGLGGLAAMGQAPWHVTRRRRSFCMTNLSRTDPALYALLKSQINYERHTLKMTASENFVSSAVLEATGSILTNKYAEGYPDARYYEGNDVVDMVENLARERLKTLFGAEHANVQPYSGSPANAAAYRATIHAWRQSHGAPGVGWRPLDPRLAGKFLGHRLCASSLRRRSANGTRRLRSNEGYCPQGAPEADMGRGNRLSPPVGL